MAMLTIVTSTTELSHFAIFFGLILQEMRLLALNSVALHLGEQCERMLPLPTVAASTDHGTPWHVERVGLGIWLHHFFYMFIPSELTQLMIIEINVN